MMMMIMLVLLVWKELRRGAELSSVLMRPCQSVRYTPIGALCVFRSFFLSLFDDGV